MADAIVTARVVPANVAGDIDAIVTDLLAEGLDTVVVDPGGDLVVSADITHSEAADADGSVATTAIEDAITAVGDCVLQGEVHVEADPALNAPTDVSLDISDADTASRTYTPTLSQGAKVVSVEITTNEIPSEAVQITRGNPQAHDSQKSNDGSFDLLFGPAVTGDDVGSPHDVIVTVTDSNGRTVTDTIAVTVTA